MKKRLKIILTFAGYISLIVAIHEQVKNRESNHKQGFYEKYIKRVQDFWCASLAAIILSPVMLIIAVLVRVKLGAPVIFRQKRPGKDEKIFELYKFRTMTDEKGLSGELLPDEKRLTEFGKALRSSSLDELPEIVNIIRGDMSVVGPRPLLVEYLERYNEEQKHRHDVKPGLTGLAQISGRNKLSWEEKFINDIEYVNHITFITDWKIIFKTIRFVLKRDGISAAASATVEYFEGNKGKEISSK